MLADQGTREMTFSAGNMLVNKTLLTPGSVSLKISYMEPKKIDEYVLVRLTDEITKKLYVPGHARTKTGSWRGSRRCAVLPS